MFYNPVLYRDQQIWILDFDLSITSPSWKYDLKNVLNVWAAVSQRYGLIQWKYLSLPTEPEAKLDSSLPVSSFFSLSHNGSESELLKQWWYCAFHSLQQNGGSLRRDRNVFISLQRHKILVAYEQKETNKKKKFLSPSFARIWVLYGWPEPWWWLRSVWMILLCKATRYM